MSWFPIGPDFVLAPRDGNFKRLSLRNEVGRQGLVSNIAIDPTDPTTIYVVIAPSSGGTSAFRSTNNGTVESQKVVPIHFSGSLTKSCRSSSERTQAPANEEARAN